MLCFRFSGFALLVLAGCASGPAPHRAAIDLTASGWIVREGQAVWKPTPKATDASGAPAAQGIAGELTVAAHPSGQTWVQFSKTPLPIVTAETDGPWWRVTFAAEGRTFRGRGAPPDRILWLHLARAFQSGNPQGSWILTNTSPESWHFENRASHESLDGFLSPASPSPSPTAR